MHIWLKKQGQNQEIPFCPFTAIYQIYLIFSIKYFTNTINRKHSINNQYFYKYNHILSIILQLPIRKNDSCIVSYFILLYPIIQYSIIVSGIF